MSATFENCSVNCLCVSIRNEAIQCQTWERTSMWIQNHTICKRNEFLDLRKSMSWNDLQFQLILHFFLSHENLAVHQNPAFTGELIGNHASMDAHPTYGIIRFEMFWVFLTVWPISLVNATIQFDPPNHSPSFLVQSIHLFHPLESVSQWGKWWFYDQWIPDSPVDVKFNFSMIQYFDSRIHMIHQFILGNVVKTTINHTPNHHRWYKPFPNGWFSIVLTCFNRIMSYPIIIWFINH